MDQGRKWGNPSASRAGESSCPKESALIWCGRCTLKHGERVLAGKCDLERVVADNNRENSGLVRVDRACADLRRGGAVVILGNGGRGGAADTGFSTVVAVSAELSSDDQFPDLDSGALGRLHLALTSQRARVLHIDPGNADLVLLKTEARSDVSFLRGLADPTADLSHPLRGPFYRADTPPTRAAAAALELCKLARLLPAALTRSLTAATRKEAEAWAGRHDLLVVDAQEVADYPLASAQLLRKVADARVPLAEAEDARVLAFRPGNGGVEHLAVVIGSPILSRPVLTRIHSECLTGDVLGSLRCDCGDQLRGALREISAVRGGVLLYLAQEGRGIGLVNKLRAYALQDQGFDTVEANLRLGFASDERLFQPAANMLSLLGIDCVRLLTNNPDKVEGLERCGVTVTERVPHAFPANDHNAFYLSTKARKSGHLL